LKKKGEGEEGGEEERFRFIGIQRRWQEEEEDEKEEAEAFATMVNIPEDDEEDEAATVAVITASLSSLDFLNLFDMTRNNFLILSQGERKRLMVDVGLFSS
jgi:hypothetical protein